MKKTDSEKQKKKLKNNKAQWNSSCSEQPLLRLWKKLHSWLEISRLGLQELSYGPLEARKVTESTFWKWAPWKFLGYSLEFSHCKPSTTMVLDVCQGGRWLATPNSEAAYGSWVTTPPGRLAASPEQQGLVAGEAVLGNETSEVLPMELDTGEATGSLPSKHSGNKVSVISAELRSRPSAGSPQYYTSRHCPGGPWSVYRTLKKGKCGIV